MDRVPDYALYRRDNIDNNPVERGQRPTVIVRLHDDTYQEELAQILPFNSKDEMTPKSWTGY